MPLGTLNIPAIQAACYYSGRLAVMQSIVVHSVESEIKRGLAVGLAGPNWFGKLSCQSSANTIADPGAAVEMVAPDDTAWAVGNGNARTWSQEHAGRAAFSRAQWTTSDGLAMLKRSAAAAAIVALRYGIPARWLSVVQLASGEKGFATHNDCRLAFGGTDHTDPGPGFPYDIYIGYVAAYMGGAPLQDGFLMALTDAQQGSLYSALLNDAKPGVSNIQYILNSLSTLLADHAKIKQDLSDLQDVVWRGGAGTPKDATIGQTLKRIEDEKK